MAASKLNDINEKIRAQLFRKGSKGLSGVARTFRQADFNGNKKLDEEEFLEALAFCGLFLDKWEVKALFKSYDRDGDGNINYEELLHGIQLPLSAKRMEMVQRAFEILDKDGSGVITVEDLAGVYDASKHPDVLEGKRTKAQVATGFLKGFEGGEKKDGKITRKEFEKYYEDLGASIPSDEYFVQMMANCWKIKRAGAKAEACTMKKLLGLLKKKVAQKTRGGKSEALTLRKSFNYFDQDESGFVNASEFQSALNSYGIILTADELAMFFKHFAGKDNKISSTEFIESLQF